MTKVFWSQNGLFAPPSQPLQMHLYISFIYIYIYNIESVFLLKSISMIIYIYQGMMALGKGEIHHEGVEKGNTGQGGWGKKYKKLGSNKCSSKGGTHGIFTVSHFKEVLMI